MQTCAICGEEVVEIKRYPRKLCCTCVKRAQSADGRPLVFGADSYGSFMAWYADTKEIHDGGDCFVDGVPCRAGEDYYGGYVVVAK